MALPNKNKKIKSRSQMPEKITRAPKGKARSSVPVVNQIGAFCYRWTNDELEFLLVTSSHGRWILPKGWPMPGKSDRKTAAIEAWEEAGVRKGKTSKKPLVMFQAKKHRKSAEVLKTRIAVHTIKVQSIAKRYPEDERRRRRWVTVPEAMSLVTDKKQRYAIRKLVKKVTRKRMKNAA